MLPESSYTLSRHIFPGYSDFHIIEVLCRKLQMVSQLPEQTPDYFCPGEVALVTAIAFDMLQELADPCVLPAAPIATNTPTTVRMLQTPSTAYLAKTVQNGCSIVSSLATSELEMQEHSGWRFEGSTTSPAFKMTLMVNLHMLESGLISIQTELWSQCHMIRHQKAVCFEHAEPQIH